EYGAWLTGAALLLLFGGARLWAENERERGLEVLRAIAPAAVSDAGIDQSLWSEKRAREYAEAVTRPGDPVGALLIPSIRLEVPVYSGTSELNLNRGAGHIEGTSPLGADGNVGIAAHRDGFFRGLQSVHLDAEILLEV